MNSKILIVDDSQLLGIQLRNIISKMKFKDIDVVKTGNDAIQQFKNKHHDIIFLDLVLPDMSGFEVLDEIKKLGQPKIIVQTASSNYENIAKAKSMGIEHYITKPYFENELKKILFK